MLGRFLEPVHHQVGHFGVAIDLATNSKLKMVAKPTVLPASSTVTGLTRIPLVDDEFITPFDLRSVALRTGRVALQIGDSEGLGEPGSLGVVQQFPSIEIVRRVFPGVEF